MQEKILDIARRLSHPFDLAQLLEEIVETGREALAADRASVLLLDREKNEFYSRATSDGDTLRFPADRGIAGETLQAGILRIDDCYADSRFNRDVDRQTGYKTRCMISVALIGVDEQAVGVMQLLNASQGRFNKQDELLAETVAGFAAVAIQRAQATEDRVRKAKLEHDLDVAREIQMALIPEVTPTVSGYSISTLFQPADETGGDMFDLFPFESQDGKHTGLTILLADATGHGIGAAVSVTQVRSMLRMAALLHGRLDALCLHMNNQLVDDLPTGKFVTAFFGRLLPESHELHYQSLGQAPLLHYKNKSDELLWLPASSIPMGLLANPPAPRPAPIVFAEGDLFVLLSDGFYEQPNPADEEFGVTRVGEIVRQFAAEGTNAVVRELSAQLEQFKADNEQDDDLTAVVLKRD